MVLCDDQNRRQSAGILCFSQNFYVIVRILLVSHGIAHRRKHGTDDLGRTYDPFACGVNVLKLDAQLPSQIGCSAFGKLILRFRGHYACRLK
jgi:hypothetical protein